MSGIIAQNILDSSGLVKAPAGGGAWNFIKKLTASGDGTLDFVDGASDVVLDSTYKEYLFTFNNIHPADNSIHFGFNGSIDSGSNWNVTKTTTDFRANHYENDSGTAFGYSTYDDLQQSTAYQYLASDVGNENDECTSGTLHIFEPSSSVFVKHFNASFDILIANEQGAHNNVAGYFNTTSPIDAISFKFSSGNIDLGDICLYGITT